MYANIIHQNHTAVLQLSYREIFIFLNIPTNLTGSFAFFSKQNKAKFCKKAKIFVFFTRERNAKKEKFSQNDFSFSLQILTWSIFHHIICNIKDCFSNTKIYYFHSWICRQIITMQNCNCYHGSTLSPHFACLFSQAGIYADKSIQKQAGIHTN